MESLPLSSTAETRAPAKSKASQTDPFCYPKENFGVTEITALVGCEKILSDVLFYPLTRKKTKTPNF